MSMRDILAERVLIAVQSAKDPKDGKLTCVQVPLWLAPQIVDAVLDELTKPSRGMRLLAYPVFEEIGKSIHRDDLDKVFGAMIRAIKEGK